MLLKSVLKEFNRTAGTAMLHIFLIKPTNLSYDKITENNILHIFVLLMWYCDI